MNIHTVGNLLGVTAVAAGVAEFCRVTLAPVVVPVYMVAPPISPEDWEKWWPLVSSAIVSLVGLFTVVRNKLTSGFKAELKEIHEALDDHIAESREDRIKTKSDIKGLRDDFEGVQVTVAMLKAKATEAKDSKPCP